MGMKYVTNEMTSKMTDKEQRFADEFMVDFKPMEAAIRAGYPAKSAAQCACQVLARPHVQEYIQIMRDRLSKKFEINREMVVAEVAKIAFSDIRRVFDQHGNLQEIVDLDDFTAASISSVEVEELYAGNGNNRLKIGVVKKLKQWDKIKALDVLNKMFGFYAPIKVDAADSFIEFLKQTSNAAAKQVGDSKEV